MALKCILCKRPPDKVNKISLHCFPNRQKYPVVYNRWLAACDLNEKDDVSGKRICSCHFREQDKSMDYTFTRIKPEAIPLINVKTPKATLQQQPEIQIEEDPTPHPHEEKSSELISTVERLSQTSEKVIVEILNNMDDLDNHFDRLYSRVMEKKTCTVITFPMKAGLAPMETISADATHDVSETSTTNECGTLERTLDTTEEAENVSSDIQPPQEKRRYFHPRYISEIQIQDVANPQSASQIIRFVKEEDRRKKLKIKKLQAAKRRLQKRITSLEDIVGNKKTST